MTTKWYVALPFGLLGMVGMVGTAIVLGDPSVVPAWFFGPVALVVSGWFFATKYVGTTGSSRRE